MDVCEAELKNTVLVPVKEHLVYWGTSHFFGYVGFFVAFTKYIRTGEQRFLVHGKINSQLGLLVLYHSWTKVHIGLSIKFWGDVYSYELLGSFNFEVEQKKSTSEGELLYLDTA